MPDDAKVPCDACGKSYKWNDKFAGKKVKCKCGNVMRFPTAPPTPMIAEEDTYELALDDSSPSKSAPAPSAPKPAAPLATDAGGDELANIGMLEPTDDQGGAFLPDLDPAVAAEKPKCPSCSSDVREDAVICIKCGFNLKEGKKLETTVGKAVAMGQGNQKGRFRNTEMPIYEGFFGRLSRSWEFAKISYGILWNHKRLIVFPIFSGVAAILVLISFAIPIAMFDVVSRFEEGSSSSSTQQTTQVAAATETAEQTPAVREIPPRPQSPDVSLPPEQYEPAYEQWTKDVAAWEQRYGEAAAAQPVAEPEPAVDSFAAADAGDWNSEEAWDSEQAWDGEGSSSYRTKMTPGEAAFFWSMVFAYYFCTYFVIVFFNTGLIACAMKVASGEVPTIGYGMKIAMKRLPQIAMWAAVSAVVGLILRMIENANEKVGRIVAMILGSGWTILTFFVVPVLAVEGVGPFTAIKKSVGVLKETWGESVLGNFSLGWMNMIVTIPLFLIWLGAMWLSIQLESAALVTLTVIAGLVGLVILAAASSAADIVFKALLYNYATGREMPAEIDQDDFGAAFAAKG